MGRINIRYPLKRTAMKYGLILVIATTMAILAFGARPLTTSTPTHPVLAPPAARPPEATSRVTPKEMTARAQSPIQPRVPSGPVRPREELPFMPPLPVSAPEQKPSLLSRTPEVMLPDTSLEDRPVSKEEPDKTLWDGPVLWQQTNMEPVHLILVEKALQKLHLYRYDGEYEHLKTYDCATGQRPGKKRKEKDQKTPEGIYFNTKTFRDRKITIFGDRAFGLDYPNPFDTLEGNGGRGIFIHGSDRTVKPLSSKGCIVLSVADLAEIDPFIQLQETAIIIGDRLPYRFAPAPQDISTLIPFLKTAMVPEKYAHLTPRIDGLTAFGYKGRMIAAGKLKIKEAGNLSAFSKLYLARPGTNLWVLFKREWWEVQARIHARAAPVENE